MATNSYISIEELLALPAASIASGMRLLAVPAGATVGNAASLVEWDDFKQAAVGDLASQVNSLSSTVSGGPFQSAQSFTLSGVVTGSTMVTGHGATSLSTAIADAALSIAKTNGLQSALNALMPKAGGVFTGGISAPGMINTPISLGGTNLNTLNTATAPGVYQQEVSATATPALNYPVMLAGTLLVFNHGLGPASSAGMGQLYLTYGQDATLWYRTSLGDGSVWNAWNQIWGSNSFDPTQYLGINAAAVSAAKWTTARTLSLTGAVTGSVAMDGSGNPSMGTSLATIGLGNLASIASGTILGNNTASSAAPSALSVAAVSSLLGLGSAASQSASAFLGASATAVAASKWATARTLTLTGGVTGSVSLDGSANVSLATSFNTSNLAPAGAGLLSPVPYTDMNLGQSSVTGSWSPSSANIAGLDQYGTVITIPTQPTLVPQNSNWINQLAFGTSGTLVWRQNVNGAGWTNKTIWTSASFNPSNFLQIGAQNSLIGSAILNTTAGPLLFESNSNAHDLGIRTGPSSAYQYFTFQGDGAFYTPLSVRSGGDVIASLNNGFGIRLTAGQSPGYSGMLSDIRAGGTPGQFYGTNVQWYFGAGNNDAASTSGANAAILSWQGIGFGPSSPGMLIPIGTYSHWFNVRTGDAGFQGNLTLNGALNTGSDITAPDLILTGQQLQVGKSNEGDIWMGNNDSYLFGNTNNAGYYSTSNGYAYQWAISARTFTVYGTFNIQSDKRVKKHFRKLTPRPLWRKLDYLSWQWKASGLTGYGPTAQAVEAVAPEYVREDKTNPVATSLGKSERAIEAAKQRIADGKERGMLSVDKSNLTLEMVMAAGSLIDSLCAKVERLEKQVKALKRFVH